MRITANAMHWFVSVLWKAPRSTVRQLLVALVLGLALSPLLPHATFAQGTIPRITLTPSSASPGGTVRVDLADHATGTFCVGFDGPGSNYALGVTPSFHVNLGKIVIGSDGTGSSTVTVPANAASGYYNIIVGGCAPQPDLGPLAWDATAELAVGTAAPLTSTPHPGTVWYFAEGSTQAPFDTWLHLFNPSPTQTATATITFFANRSIPPVTISVPPVRRTSLYLNQIIPPVAFGMRVNASLPIVAERSMFFRQDGTASVGIPSPSTTWLLGEGSTQTPFDTWILILNPNNTTANVKMQFLTQTGQIVPYSLSVGPRSRSSIYVNQVLPNAAFSTRIGSSQPIVVERSMYKTTTGGGHNAPGVVAPANAWYFAEGSTQPPFDTWYLIENPNPHPVRILMRFFLQTGGPGKLLDFVIPPTSRQSLYVNTVQPNAAGGATLVSDGGPVVAERAMYFRGGATDTIGAGQLARNWLFAEGSTQPPFDTWLLLVNPSGIDNAHATVTFGLANGQTVTRSVTVPGEGRTSLFANLLVPNQTITTRITSDLPIVAERSMYFGNGNGGTNTIGTQQ